MQNFERGSAVAGFVIYILLAVALNIMDNPASATASEPTLPASAETAAPAPTTVPGTPVPAASVPATIPAAPVPAAPVTTSTPDPTSAASTEAPAGG